MSDSLALLVELAGRRRDSAARALAAEVAAHAERERRARQLAEYVEEYRGRLARLALAGAEVGALGRLARFVQRLEAAAMQQARDLEAGEARLAGARSAWQEAERRLRSWEVIARRRARVRERQALRVERRLEDEIAGRDRANRMEAKEPPS